MEAIEQALRFSNIDNFDEIKSFGGGVDGEGADGEEETFKNHGNIYI